MTIQQSPEAIAVTQDLDDLEKNSLDYYAALRSVYRQHREAELRDTLPQGAVATRRAAPEDTP